MSTLLVVSILLVIGEAAGSERYVGCFEDPNNTELPGITVDNKKVKKCIDFCMSEDYQFSIDRKGCYCGESYGQGSLPEGRCYAFCSGTPAEDCVGKYTHSVWYTSEKEGSESSQSESSESVSRESRNVNVLQTGQTVYLGSFGSIEIFGGFNTG